MKTLLKTFSICLLFASIVAAQQPAAPPPPQREATPPAQDSSSVRTYEGQLSKVDSAAKTITVKGNDDKEMTFSFNDQTQIMGADDGAQGLTGKTGSTLKVSYREDHGVNRATRIEISPKK